MVPRLLLTSFRHQVILSFMLQQKSAGLLRRKTRASRCFKVLPPIGSRGRFAPQSDHLVFDRKNKDGYFEIYLSDLEGNIIRPLTEGNPAIGQRNNGNAVFHPSGNYIIFIFEAKSHYGNKALAEPGIGLFNNL